LSTAIDIFANILCFQFQIEDLGLKCSILMENPKTTFQGATLHYYPHDCLKNRQADLPPMNGEYLKE
jgi:hypothetical protein